MSRRRDIRMRNDAEELKKLAAQCDWFDLSCVGDPPHTFHLTFRCRGLMKNASNQVVETNLHKCTIQLTAGYPTQAPNVTWQTPIFHPNIRGQAVCHSNQWAPSWSLADFVVELSDMARFEKVNVNSPLDRVAADWVRHNQNRLPVDTRELRAKPFSITIRPK
ncbi:MAG: hypothetical protein KC609_04595 [Myxococcales bacterium]|nr:hypothetical protein [Myxococcales bacterium]